MTRLVSGVSTGGVADTNATVQQFPWDIAQSVNPSGRTLVDGRLVPGQPTVILVHFGQSNGGASSVDSGYTPTNALVHNLNIHDGGVYVCRDPVLGSSMGISLTGAPTGGSWVGRLGDALIDAGFCQRTIHVPIAVNATSLQNWLTADPLATVPGPYAEGACTHRIDVAANRMRAAGYVNADGTIKCSGITVQIGETDAGNVTQQAWWEAWFANVRGRFRARGFACPIFVSLATHNFTTSRAAVRAAQAAVVDNTVGVFAGPDFDALTGGNRQADDIHFNATGAAVVALLWRATLVSGSGVERFR